MSTALVGRLCGLDLCLLVSLTDQVLTFNYNLLQSFILVHNIDRTELSEKKQNRTERLRPVLVDFSIESSRGQMESGLLRLLQRVVRDASMGMHRETLFPCASCQVFQSNGNKGSLRRVNCPAPTTKSPNPLQTSHLPPPQVCLCSRRRLVPIIIVSLWSIPGPTLAFLSAAQPLPTRTRTTPTGEACSWMYNTVSPSCFSR